MSGSAIFLILLLITISSEFSLACAGKKEKTDQNITVDDDIDYGDDHDDRTIKMILLDHCGLTSNINLRVGGCFYQKSHPTHHI